MKAFILAGALLASSFGAHAAPQVSASTLLKTNSAQNPSLILVAEDKQGGELRAEAERIREKYKAKFEALKAEMKAELDALRAKAGKQAKGGKGDGAKKARKPKKQE